MDANGLLCITKNADNEYECDYEYESDFEYDNEGEFEKV